MKIRKLLLPAALSVTLAASIAACGGSAEDSAPEKKDPPAQSDNNTEPRGKIYDSSESDQAEASTQAAAIDTESPGEKETFYGDWEIKKAIAFGAAGTYSNEDIKGLTGKQISFSKDRATCFGDKREDMNQTAKNPVYKKSEIAKGDMSSEYRVTFDQLGIDGQTVTQVDATGDNGICTTFFITPDSDQLILYGGGTFFELVRAGDQNKTAATEENKEEKAVALVKKYLRVNGELVNDENHFVQFEEKRNDYYIVRYSTLVSGHSSTNGRYAVNVDEGKVIELKADTDLSFLDR